MKNRNKVNIWWILLCSVAMCALVTCMLIVYLKGFDFFTLKLEAVDPNKTDDMTNTLWLIEKVLYVLPVCVLLAFQVVFYKLVGGKKSITHRESAWEMTVALVFTYAVLLPLVITYSKNNPPLPDPETGEETLSIIARSMQWFMWQILIFAPAILYHGAMAKECVDECGDEFTSEEEETEIENQDI